jgi:hypothetical protein
VGSRTVLGAESAKTSLLWNPYQAAFLQALAARTPAGSRMYNRLALFAGRRGGKTRIGAVAAVSEMKPGTLGWACAPSYPELQDYVIPAVLGLIPRSWFNPNDWSQSRLELRLLNGARVAFRSLDDPNRARGPGLDWLWIDEARKVQELAWDTAMPALSDRRGVAWFTTTPNGRDWCHKRLWKMALDGEPGMWAARYYTSENPSIDPREIEIARRQMDPLFFAQEYQADFVTFTGAIYAGMLEKQILTTEAEIRKVLPEWPRINPERPCYVGLDPGADHPFAGTMVVITEAGVVCVGEYLERNRSALEHKRGLIQMLAAANPSKPFEPERWAIDRSQKQMAIELAQAPYAIYSTAAENDFRAGINRVQAWLQTGRLWFVAPSVPRTIEQLRGYKYDQNYNPDGTVKREQAWKEDDDLPDALRYLLMIYPEEPVAVEREEERKSLAGFSAEQRWAYDRAQRIEKRERGYYDDEDDASDGPDPEPDEAFIGTGDMWQ